MKTIKIPYGRRTILFKCSKDRKIDILLPIYTTPNQLTASTLVENAIQNPINGILPFKDLTSRSRVVIVINDKTRPVPNGLLLSHLLPKLNECGVSDSNIRFIIASGTHHPMLPNEYSLILSDELITRFSVFPHDCDDSANLVFIGKTKNGTPVSVNKRFMEADLRIVVGDIELHHFAGFSGGVKSAAIGLCGRKTINYNHMLLLEEKSTVGEYRDNPLRNDIEEIGEMIRVDLALNAVLDEKKEIQGVFFGKPRDVMNNGIELVRKLCQVPVRQKYDLVLASAGGYPKDINLYQAQKALTHASLFCKDGGRIILLAECIEGIGSEGYLQFMEGKTSAKEIIACFLDQGFSVGPHKAYQIARLLEKFKLSLASNLDPDLVKSLLIDTLLPKIESIDKVVRSLPMESTIAVLPYATACIPNFHKEAVV